MRSVTQRKMARTFSRSVFAGLVRCAARAGSLAALTVAASGMPWAAAAAAAAAQLARQVVPAEAGLEDEQDAGAGLAVGQRLAAGVAEAARLGGREQGLDPLPQGIGQQGRGHEDTSWGAVPPWRRC